MFGALRSGYTPESLLDRLPSCIEVQPWMLTDSAQAAGLWILTSFSTHDVRIWNNVTPTTIDFALIIAEEGWSNSERALLCAAGSLHGSCHMSVDLTDLAASLDDDRWTALLQGMQIRRVGLRGEWS